jgi:anti-anti-sigma factor
MVDSEGQMTDPGVPRPSTAARLWTLDICRESRDGVRIVTLGGRIGVAASDRLTAVLKEEVQGGNARILVVLDRVEYISSAGLLALQDAAVHARERGTPFALSRLSEPVRLAFELAGILSTFTIEPTGEVSL